MNEPTKQEQGLQRTDNPFKKQGNDQQVNAGVVQIQQSKAIAEAQGKLILAKNFPRDPERSFSAMMESCMRYSFADQAMYSFPRGGQTVSGPSIRMAEELARCWGNIEFGIRELSRKEGESEMEAFAWDLEANVIRSIHFTVRHARDTKAGAKVLTDERDIYEVTANMGGRRMRACLLTILPADYVDAAVAQCDKTLKSSSGELLVDRVRKALIAFKKLGVTVEMIEKKLNKKTSEMFPDDLGELISIYNSINDGHTKADDWFIIDGKAAPSIDTIKSKKTDPKPDPKPADEKPEIKKEEKAVTDSSNKLPDQSQPANDNDAIL